MIYCEVNLIVCHIYDLHPILSITEDIRGRMTFHRLMAVADRVYYFENNATIYIKNRSVNDYQHSGEEKVIIRLRSVPYDPKTFQ